MKRYRLAKIVFLIIVIAPLAIFVFGEIVMYLWNNVLVPVLHVSPVTFWQGLGILVLAKILFGSMGGPGAARRDRWKQRMMWKQMTPDQREKLRQEWWDRSKKWGYGKPANESDSPVQ